MAAEKHLDEILQNEEIWEKVCEADIEAYDKEQVPQGYNPEFSDRFKKKMNRLFREQIGGDYAIHPEVDNAYERIRSGIIRRCLIIKERIDKKAGS